LRFKKWLWGLAAIIALVHDVVIAAGAISLTRKENPGGSHKNGRALEFS